MPSSCVRSRLTRRTATVTISASDASMARIIVSLALYLPVPRTSRERNSRPAIVNGLSINVASCVIVAMSSASNKVHELKRVAIAHFAIYVLLAIQNLAIVFHHDHAWMQSEAREQISDIEPRLHISRIAIHHDSNISFAHSHALTLSRKQSNQFLCGMHRVGRLPNRINYCDSVCTRAQYLGNTPGIDATDRKNRFAARVHTGRQTTQAHGRYFRVRRRPKNTTRENEICAGPFRFGCFLRRVR